MDRRAEGSTIEMEKRATTIISVLSKVTSMIVWLVALVMALTEMTFHIEPLLAGLGVAGLALGLGAQTLIKDWLGGIFLLLEDQLRIGDSVVINGTSGAVEEINLRTTLLRSENGAVHVIANGSITMLSNLTRDYSYYVFEATLAHRADVDRALAILNTIGGELASSDPYRSLILAPIEVMGVDRLADRGVTIKARIKTLPSKQAIVGRELNRRVKARLDAEGIAFPPPFQAST
jgi:small conductance mechanosensitive channel